MIEIRAFGDYQKTSDNHNLFYHVYNRYQPRIPRVLDFDVINNNNSDSKMKDFDIILTLV